MVTPRQQRTLVALCRRLVPAAADAAAAAELAATVTARLSLISAHHRDRFLHALSLIGHPAFVLLLTGRPRSFAALPDALQDTLLERCATSRLPLLRLLFDGIKRLIMHTAYTTPQLRAAIGQLPPLPERAPLVSWEGPLANAQPVVAPASRPRVTRRVVPTGVVERADIRADLNVTADVCIVGSGAGGSVAACMLAEAGYDVAIIEAGPYRTAADFPSDEATALTELYADTGMRGTDDLAVSLLQGRCAGGGTTINWMVMLRTPDYVLEEWQRAHGVENMSVAAMRAVFERFERENGVAQVADAAHSPSNRILLDGSHALGWRARAAAVNARDCMRAGMCGLGCPYGAKQGMLDTYLARALAAGARMYCDTHAHSITSDARGKHVHAEAGAHAISINAKNLILAAGAVETPALLQRSGIGGAGVGRHLRLHPTTAVVGIFDRDIHAGTGIPLTTYCNEFTQLRGDYGHWIETPPLGPGLAAVALPGFGSEHYRYLQQYARVAPMIVLVRDGATDDPSQGRVTWRGGRARIEYRLSAADRAVLVHGMESAARIQFAMGARSVLTLHRGAVELFSEKDIGLIGAAQRSYGDPLLFSAHVNGTCRIGRAGDSAACHPNGQLIGHPGIYVMDGSLLPTAPGVNPHETIAAVTSVLTESLLASW